MDAANPLFLHLCKIPVSSSESLSRVLEHLWDTRRTGVAPNQKPYIQSLLGLPSLQDLDPVLASLRLLIRKCLHEELTRDDIQKLFPPDISFELQRTLVMLLRKYSNQWKEESSRDQPLWKRVSNQVRANAPAVLKPFPVSELSSTLWPRQDTAATYPDSNNVGSSIPNYADSNLPRMHPSPLNGHTGSFDNLAIIPRLKSMTWTMQNRHSIPANRVAIITLRLQDYTKSPSGDIEVKFQLSKDTLEAMLRSMAYVSEQLSNLVAPS